jgi:hypothetical protein
LSAERRRRRLGRLTGGKIVAIGLIVGVGAEPTQEQFDELLARGAIEEEGFTFEALAVSPDEAADRNRLRDLYRMACVKQGWEAGLAFVDDLRFADLVIGGGRLVVVTPPTAPPTATWGGLVAGIGFTPTERDLQTLTGPVALRAGRQYVVTSFTEADAEHDETPIATYLASALKSGWPTAGARVVRQDIGGRRFLLVSVDGGPAHAQLAGAEAPAAPKSQTEPPTSSSPDEALVAPPRAVDWWERTRKRGAFWGAVQALGFFSLGIGLLTLVMAVFGSRGTVVVWGEIVPAIVVSLGIGILLLLVSTKRKAVAETMEAAQRDHVTSLTRALQHPDAAVRADAASALGDLGDLRAVDPLIATLRTDGDPYLRSVAAEALGKLGDARAFEPLSTCVQTDSSMDVALVAGKALHMLAAAEAMRSAK